MVCYFVSILITLKPALTKFSIVKQTNPMNGRASWLQLQLQLSSGKL